MICAALELQMLGYEISPTYLEQLKADKIRRQMLAKQRRSIKVAQKQLDKGSDDLMEDEGGLKRMKTVIIKHIADTLDNLMDEWKYYLNKKTGEIVEIQTEYLCIAEESEEDEDFSGYKDWEQDSIKEVLMILKNWNDYIELPDKDEIHEYNIMEKFCFSISDEKLRVKLCNAISGKGAFRRFKDAVIRHDVDNEWYYFKFEALCRIAREWCDFNKIPFVEE